MRFKTILILLTISAFAQAQISSHSLLKISQLANSLQGPEASACKTDSSQTFTELYNGFAVLAIPATLDESTTVFANQLWALPYHLDGAGQVIGMWEAGNFIPNATDPNLQTNGLLPSRIVFIEAGNTNGGHANDVALRIAGDGTSGAAGNGIAPKAQLKAWNSTNAITELTANAASLVASNHSYAYPCGWTNPAVYGANWYSYTNISSTEDYKFGYYSDFFDQPLDGIAYTNPIHSIVVAAGNDRGELRTPSTGPAIGFYTPDNGATTSTQALMPEPPADGDADGFDCVPWGATGKNVFTIGACDIIAGGYSAPTDVTFLVGSNTKSSWGPTDDGRIKPDFVAPSSGGTSYATPQVTGAIALLQQLSLRERGALLTSASLKALFAQTAFEAGGFDGPDFKHGWGLINPKGAADVLLNASSTNQVIESSLANATTDYYLFYTDGASPLVASLCWTDPKGTPITLTYTASDLDNPAPMLVNDLDVRLVNLSDVVQAAPYILDPANPTNAATTGDNFRDNIEKIVNTPTAGWYAIRVTHKGTLVNDLGAPAPQDYSLIISGASNGACVASTLPSFDNTYTGTWASTFIDGQNVTIENNLTLTTNTTFANALFNSNVEVNIPTGNTLTITGNVWSVQNVVFTGGGKLVLAGGLNQFWCGGAVVDILEVDNSNGISLEGAPIAINNYLEAKNGTLQANGHLTLVSSVGQYAQIHESGGTISGDVEFQQTVTSEGEGWHTIASPVNTTVLDLVEDMTDYVIEPSGGNVQRWDAATGAWVSPANTAASFGPTEAFNVYFGNSASRTYSTIPFTIRLKGTVNSGLVNNSVVYGASSAISNGSGWNLLANPYPENLDWNTIKSNFGGLNINDFYYVWDAASATYKFHDGSSLTPGVDVNLAGSIAPGQAFFVKLNDVNAEATNAFDFTNSNRTLANAAFYKSSLPQINLTATQNNRSDNYYLAFEAGNEIGLQPKTDAFKLFSPVIDIPQIYQYVDSANSMALNIVGLEFEDMKVPVSYNNTFSGDVQIDASIENIDPKWSVFLEDTKTKEWHNLRLAPYLFSHQAGEEQNRFLLHINKSSALDYNNLNKLTVWGNNGLFKLSLKNELTDANLVIYNVVGAVVHTSNYHTLQSVEIPFSERGVFIVHLSGANGQVYTAKWVN